VHCRPAQIRQISSRLRDCGASTTGSPTDLHLLISLSEPAPSGSSCTSLLRRGRLPPHPSVPQGRAAPSFVRPLRRPNGNGLSPPPRPNPRLVAHSSRREQAGRRQDLVGRISFGPAELADLRLELLELLDLLGVATGRARFPAGVDPALVGPAAQVSGTIPTHGDPLDPAPADVSSHLQPGGRQPDHARTRTRHRVNAALDSWRIFRKTRPGPANGTRLGGPFRSYSYRLFQLEVLAVSYCPPCMPPIECASCPSW
jgi:hypothetical protein